MIPFDLSIPTLRYSPENKTPATIMRATSEALLHLHPRGTFSNLPCKRHRIKQKIFADIFNRNQSGDAAGERQSDQAVVVRHRIRSYRDATPYRSRVRSKIFAEMFKSNSSGGTGGGGTSDLVVLRLPNGFFIDSFLHCCEILTYLFKRGSME